MGLIARAIERGGISTLSMTSALDITRAVKPPRAVFVDFPLGHQTGKPHEPGLQRQIVQAAFAVLTTTTTPGSIIKLPYVWDENDYSWQDQEYTPGYLSAYKREVSR